MCGSAVSSDVRAARSCYVPGIFLSDGAGGAPSGSDALLLESPPLCRSDDTLDDSRHPLGAALGRRGPGTGLRQARTAAEVAQWQRLFDSLAAPGAERVLPHLGLRTADALPLRETVAPVAQELSTILAKTKGPAAVRRANLALAGAYAELERHGARLARGVFSLGGDDFPGAAAVAAMAEWDRALRALAGRNGARDGIPAAKRDIVVALIGHHLAAMEPLDTLAAQPSAGNGSSHDVDWLVDLARWRRYAIVCRALARVLTPAERQHLVVHYRSLGTWRDVVRGNGAIAPSWG